MNKPDQSLRILFFGNTGVLHRKGKPTPSTTIRVDNISRKLAGIGHKCRIDYIKTGKLQQNKEEILNSDVVVFHRIQASARTWVEASLVPLYILAKAYGKKIVFDLDDAVFLTFPVICEFCVKLADAVFVGSHFLLSYAKKLNPNAFLIPSAVDTEAFRPSEKRVRNSGQIILGWHGSAAGHFRNIKSLKPILKELSRKHNVTFTLLGTEGNRAIQEFFTAPNLSLNFGPTSWIRYDQLPSYLKDVDIGMSPLVDSLWNRGKCAMKAIEYMSLGKPVVASPVGEHNFIIKDRVNGFLAQSNEDWLSKIEELVENADLRYRIGARARNTVTMSFSLDKVARKVSALLQDMCS